MNKQTWWDLQLSACMLVSKHFRNKCKIYFDKSFNTTMCLLHCLCIYFLNGRCDWVSDVTKGREESEAKLAEVCMQTAMLRGRFKFVRLVYSTVSLSALWDLLLTQEKRISCALPHPQAVTVSYTLDTYILLSHLTSVFTNYKTYPILHS